MPTSVERYDEAIALQQAGKTEEAIEKLQSLVGDDPEYALAHAALSVFFSRLERHDKAIEHATKVCELEGDDPFSFVALSLLCQKAGRIPEAERALMTARQAQVAAYQRRNEE
jgi:tetratricopeptide (TPR) repeat protein